MRDLRLILTVDGTELVLDRAEIPDDQPITATGVARGIRALADRIDAWSEFRRRFNDVLDQAGETA